MGDVLHAGSGPLLSQISTPFPGHGNLLLPAGDAELFRISGLGRDLFLYLLRSLLRGNFFHLRFFDHLLISLGLSRSACVSL